MTDDFKDYLSNYKKDPKKVEAKKNEVANRKVNRPRKNPFNFKFWEWMG